MKCRHLVIAILLFLCSNNALAQAENTHWNFGDGATLNFLGSYGHSGDSSSITDIAGCTSVSSGTADLLFYTNGINVWNAQHRVMPNGDSLMAGASTLATQAVLAIEYPGHDSMYMIFTLDDATASGDNGLRCSILDMRLDSGRGDIVAASKNTLVYTGLGEQLAAARVRYNNGYWIMTHKRVTDEFVAFRIDTNGIIHSPVISHAGSGHHATPSRSYNGNIGQLKFERKLYSKMAVAIYGQYKIEIFNFNNETGKVTHFLSIPTPAQPYGIEFSDLSDKLYYSLERGVYQLDMTQPATDLQLSVQPIGYSYPGHPFGDLQAAPDGRVYTAVDNASWISAFTTPVGTEISTFLDTASLLFSPSGIPTTCHKGLPCVFTTLPPAGEGPGYDSAFTVADSCGRDSLTFAFAHISNVNDVSWDFGDPDNYMFNTASGFSVQHKFSTSGRYRVTAIIHTDYFDDTIARYVNIVLCDSATHQMDCKIFVPDAFTPNYDGLNDAFRPRFTCPTDTYKLGIYNRWGERIFYTENIEDKWNGTYKNVPCELDVYFYLIEYSFPHGPLQIRKGDVTLVR